MSVLPAAVGQAIRDDLRGISWAEAEERLIRARAPVVVIENAKRVWTRVNQGRYPPEYRYLPHPLQAHRRRPVDHPYYGP